MTPRPLPRRPAGLEAEAAEACSRWLLPVENTLSREHILEGKHSTAHIRERTHSNALVGFCPWETSWDPPRCWNVVPNTLSLSLFPPPPPPPPPPSLSRARSFHRAHSLARSLPGWYSQNIFLCKMLGPCSFHSCEGGGEGGGGRGGRVGIV